MGNDDAPEQPHEQEDDSEAEEATVPAVPAWVTAYAEQHWQVTAGAVAAGVGNPTVAAGAGNPTVTAEGESQQIGES